jgi:GNAT superfamily N-acetyltransferase
MQVHVLQHNDEPNRFRLVAVMPDFDSGKAADAYADEPTEPDLLLLRTETWVYLSGLYVPQPMRRQGAGRALLMEALDLAREWGLPVFLNAEPYGAQPMSREQLLRFYGEMGFRMFPGHPFSMVWGQWPGVPEWSDAGQGERRSA